VAAVYPDKRRLLQKQKIAGGFETRPYRFFVTFVLFVVKPDLLLASNVFNHLNGLNNFLLRPSRSFWLISDSPEI
jgi:hypothetical protein